jgi:hypothetical protein
MDPSLLQENTMTRPYLHTALACLTFLAGADELQDSMRPRKQETTFDASPGGLRVEPDRNNLMASRLTGTWKPDALVNQRLRNPEPGAREVRGSHASSTYTVELDDTVA